MRKAEPLAGLGGLALLASLFLTGTGYLRPVPGDLRPRGRQLSPPRPTRTASPTSSSRSRAARARRPDRHRSLTNGPAKSIGTAVLASAFGWIAILIVAISCLGDPILEYRRSGSHSRLRSSPGWAVGCHYATNPRQAQLPRTSRGFRRPEAVALFLAITPRASGFRTSSSSDERGSSGSSIARMCRHRSAAASMPPELRMLPSSTNSSSSSRSAAGTGRGTGRRAPSGS